MRASTIWPVLILALSSYAQAQTPAAQPPKLDKIEEVDTPITVTTKPANERKVTEKREGGRVTEAKVKSGPSTYTVKPNSTTSTTALPGDASGGSANRGPQWTVMEFDIGKKKTKQKEGEAADDASAPPPPPPKR
ncbi:hypothetical protein LJR289_005989 [Pseudoduganella sp. LjRoot289]|uniref:hypothetical protein n=1 Tax=Pseudoduganella sp. LjRoot289 TaxID=3342314 RepID=UPI003ED0795F